QLSVAVVQQQNARDETHLLRKRDDLFGLMGRTCAENTTNNHSKTRMLTKPLKALLQVSQNFLCCVISLDTINRNLHFLQSRFIKRLDQLRLQQKPVGDHTCAQEPEFPTHADKIGELRMQSRLPAGQRDTKSAKTFQLQQALLQDFGGDWVANLVKFRTIAARQIASANDYQLCKKWAVTKPRENSQRALIRGTL